MGCNCAGKKKKAGTARVAQNVRYDVIQGGQVLSSHKSFTDANRAKTKGTQIRTRVLPPGQAAEPSSA